MRVLELMKTHVIKTHPAATLRDAVDMMDLYQVSGLPVVEDEDRLVGVVTEFDVINALLPHYADSAAPRTWAGEKPDLEALVDAVRSRTVGEAMTSPAVSIDENADVLEAASLMLQHRIKRLPVTSEGRLVGVISRIDICQAILEGQLGIPSLRW